MKGRESFSRIREKKVPVPFSYVRNIRKSLHNRVVQSVDDALLQRDDRVVSDRDALRTHLRATFRDVAIADTVGVLELLRAIARIERVHLERRCVNEMPRADELVEHPMLAQHVTHVLAEKTLDALAELLNALDVGLEHAPRSVRRVRRPRRERLDTQLCAKIPRHVGHEIPDGRKGSHWLDRDRLGKVELIQASHAHQPRMAVDFGRTRAALAGFAVPSHGEIVGLRGLNLVDRVEHDHAVGYGRRVVFKPPALAIAAPDSKRCSVGHHFIASITAFSSLGISGIGARPSSMLPSALLRITMFTLPNAGSLSG